MLRASLPLWAALAVATAPVHAKTINHPLVGQDLQASGDQLVTLDKNTGLQWLDLSATKGLSVLDVQHGAGGWTAQGFRYATFDEIKGLYADAGMAPFDGCSYDNPTGGCGMQGSYSDGVQFFELLGATSTRMAGFMQPIACNGWHSGVCDDHLEAGQWVPTLDYTYVMPLALSKTIGIGTIDPSGPSPVYMANLSTGSWLVRSDIGFTSPVPEPSSLGLFAAGVAALFAFGRTRRGR